jgi:NAD(P)-dependent dehydrogenase (short-subunit alcohol dehydrogenase family)
MTLNTAIVTGGTGAIGFSIVLQLVSSGTYDVTIGCCNVQKGESTVSRVQRATGSANVRYSHVDTSSHDSIREFASRWRGPLHLLMNVASTAPRRREVTAAGVELQFATNVLGYFWMIEEFTRHLARPSRVVNVASNWANSLRLDDLQMTVRRYDNGVVYRQSKQAERMLTAAFARRLAGRGITVNGCHPGVVDSQISRDLGFRGSESPEEGAATPIYVATSDEGGSVTGKYFSGRRLTNCQFAADTDACERLYAICETFG